MPVVKRGTVESKKKARKVDKLDTKKPSKKRHDWKPNFLRAFRDTANVRAACDAAKISRQAAYNARLTDKHFADQWDEAEEDACDLLELEARRRAYEGVEEPVFGSMGTGMGSGEVGRIVRYSNTLMMFLLRAHRPAKYGDKARNENVNLDVSTLNDKQLDLLANGAPIATVLAATSAGGAGAAQAPTDDGHAKGTAAHA